MPQDYTGMVGLPGNNNGNGSTNGVPSVGVSTLGSTVGTGHMYQSVPTPDSKFLLKLM